MTVSPQEEIQTLVSGRLRTSGHESPITDRPSSSMPVLRDRRFRNLSQEPGSDDDLIIIDIVIAISGKAMTKTGLANAHVTLGELAAELIPF